jgi:hypothetical protein
MVSSAGTKDRLNSLECALESGWIRIDVVDILLSMQPNLFEL